jgi:phage repressor protein C with HTH and peptisase S24 domain
VPGSDGAVPGATRAMPLWGLARVVGDSMRPTLRPGDRLLLSYRRSVRVGDVVVARLPGGVVATKRAARRQTTELGEPGWWLVSDNPDQGSDSRQYGAIAAADVVAVVLRRIWPLVRRGAVPDSTGA